MTDLFYDDDMVIPYVMRFRAERVRNPMTTADLRRMFNAKEVRP